jgi:hypothetical protein
MTNFEFNWNNRYPGKFPLVPLEDNGIEKDELMTHRTGNISCLPFKKRWLDGSTNYGYDQNELQILTEEDIKWLESLSKTTEKEPLWPHEIFDEILNGPTIIKNEIS